MLFRRLTAESRQGIALFDALTREARRPHWYIEGEVPDTIDGRFAVVATITALILVRLEQAGDAGNRASVALTERFIEVMESEHRELGLGDPKLGKTVRKLVGALARRTGLWRLAVTDDEAWTDVVRGSLYQNGASPDALAHSTSELRRLWHKLTDTEFDALADGKFA